MDSPSLINIERSYVLLFLELKDFSAAATITGNFANIRSNIFGILIESIKNCFIKGNSGLKDVAHYNCKYLYGNIFIKIQIMREKKLFPYNIMYLRYNNQKVYVNTIKSVTTKTINYDQSKYSAEDYKVSHCTLTARVNHSLTYDLKNLNIIDGSTVNAHCAYTEICWGPTMNKTEIYFLGRRNVLVPNGSIFGTDFTP